MPRESLADPDPPRRPVPDPGAIAAWLLPFGLIVFLGMQKGGFEQPVYSQVGIAAWFLVGVGVLAAALPCSS